MRHVAPEFTSTTWAQTMVSGDLLGVPADICGGENDSGFVDKPEVWKLRRPR